MVSRYVHLSAGELLREERTSGSSDGQLIDEYIREGRIVPVAISLGLLRKAMEASGPHSRFLIDGFPRNSDNVEARQLTHRVNDSHQCYHVHTHLVCLSFLFFCHVCVCVCMLVHETRAPARSQSSTVVSCHRIVVTGEVRGQTEVQGSR